MASDLPGFFEGTEMSTAGWWEALWPDPAVLATIGLRRVMDVVDRCSGDGWFTLQIAKIARHVVAIDIDANLLEVAHHRLKEGGLTNCEFVTGNAYDVATLVRRPADFVFMANVFPRRAGSAATVACSARHAQTARRVRDHQLAPAATRANRHPGRATRAKNGIANVA
jgi:SAM-dependent methyltransferase